MRPGVAFAGVTAWAEILEPHGWRKDPTADTEDSTKWTRPGKDSGTSATTDYQGTGLFYVFTTSTDFEAEQSYTKFAVYALLNHDGDFEGAAKDLVSKGFGDPRELATDEGALEERVEQEIGRIRVRDRARERYADEKARDRLNVHPERVLDGLSFLTEDADTVPLWGEAEKVLWAQGEGLMICGPQGVGKSTIVQQLVLARMGLRDPELFGFPVALDDRPILYLAMDRPPQIRRSLNRMVDSTDEAVAAALKRQLVVWSGPPPFDVGEAPRVFADWVALHGREPGLVVVDSLKDLAGGLSTDETGGAINSAMQLILANGTEFIDLHHQRKANAENKKPDKLADVYGSGWLTAGLGSVLLAWGEPGARTVELSHLKQPQEKVGPLMVNHTHGTGASYAADPLEKLTELAISAGPAGITEAEAVRALFDVGSDDDEYTARRSNARRKLKRLTEDGVLKYRAGSRGGKGGGGNAARYTHHLA
ncbi:hypothetical protein ROP_54310 [Rhodococcus opacus B4]|uniref:Uncharacterized protein n=1 Tax=Rhodococcus opacus (strain B4) TaxID=632772 RepID=C1AWA5_RHOOB|nr:hypothetical protein ROP_54310 [Rhodococcus opacus B4]